MASTSTRPERLPAPGPASLNGGGGGGVEPRLVDPPITGPSTAAGGMVLRTAPAAGAVLLPRCARGGRQMFTFLHICPFTTHRDIGICSSIYLRARATVAVPVDLGFLHGHVDMYMLHGHHVHGHGHVHGHVTCAWTCACT